MADRWLILLAALAVFTGHHAPARAAEVAATGAGATAEQIVTYPAGFFERYQPTTALDMVNQVPGFQLDDGTSNRGFIGAVGNLLINDDYPSAKQDTPTAILTRIPAAQVARIELIRGQVRGIDLQGQPVVANVILQDDTGAAVRWETFIQHSNTGPWKPIASVSLSDRFREVDYNVGLNVEREANGELGIERVYDGGGTLLEQRTDDIHQTGLKQMDLFLNAAAPLGETLLAFNGKFSVKNGPEERLSTRIPLSTGVPEEVLFRDSQNAPSFELGLDAERNLRSQLAAKTILLYTHNEFNLRNLQSDHDPAGVQTRLRIAETATVTREAITRLELDWTAFPGHNIQFNAEAAYNSVDGSLFQTLDTGSGPQVVDVPGANSLVEELRGDFMLKDTWVLDDVALDFGLGAETSTITQSGDVEQQRRFFFLKPQAVLTWSPVEAHRSRLLLSREVAQLDFDDFISTTVFEDNDLALGNPNLKPDTTWVAELGHEYRYGSQGVVKLGVFHHWISDVLDLLPLSASFEAPGNIGDGRRWGLVIENTIPLEWLGLAGARLDLKVRWQDSTVVDPVTGEDRVLSAVVAGFGGPPTIRFRDNGSEYVVDAAFRQDFETARVAWGWDIAAQADRPRFKVNELDLYDEGVEVNAFVETTRWLGIKIRLDVNNLLDYTETRVRTLYAGDRDLTPVEGVIIRERTPGRRIKLSLSGSF